MQNVTAQNQLPPIDEYGGILNLTPTAGKIELFGRLWPVKQIRPNYQAFIKEIFQPADKCLEVLLGMRLFITGALQFPVQALSGDEFSWWWNNILESESEGNPEKVWEDIFVVQDKITEIYRVLMISAKAGQIDSAIHASTLKIGPPREECYLSTKSFISWAIENGYSLPDILGVELGQKTPMGDSPTTNQDDKEKIPRGQKNTECYTDKLFLKYVEVARKFCQGFIDQGKQPASKKETIEYIEKYLEKSKESLGPNSRLPERLFREIWQAVPDELKRKRGVITRR